ncbi:PDR/VanB family oxidoreductase [Xenophilus azovorans]|uniref:PDR/VanB family oxidoreductase n=1 Tax=Xenophilus azovorans TaxID=151755 RepID=UPI00056DBF3E|nr:PDR/VanB family oxidoreductase [Xenophilus azovorans]
MSALRLRVIGTRAEARDVMRVELADAAGRPLPAFEPGAHVVLRLPDGMARSYSLLNDWRERHRYVLGVGRSETSQGGSEYIHAALRAGDEIDCGAPANNFPLQADASHYLLIAGGIGITPILSMVRWCVAMGRPWRLVYAVRNRSRLAFYEELAPYRDQVHFHFDDEQGGPLPVAQHLRDLPAGAQVYCCGPSPLMTAARECASGLPAQSLHFEWFAAPREAAQAPASSTQPAPSGFWIDLQRSGASFFVAEAESILDVLERHGYEVPHSCREGVCGTCETAVCAGEPDHRDYIYPESQRPALRSMLICVSRARSERLTLDL